MTLLHSSSPSLVEQENIDTEFEATINDDTTGSNPIIVDGALQYEDPNDATDVSLSDVMQQHQQVISITYYFHYIITFSHSKKI